MTTDIDTQTQQSDVTDGNWPDPAVVQWLIDKIDDLKRDRDFLLGQAVYAKAHKWRWQPFKAYADKAESQAQNYTILLARVRAGDCTNCQQLIKLGIG